MKQSKSMMVLFLTPALVTFATVFIYPIIRTVFMSFYYVKTVTDSFGKWEFVGFGNYGKLMASSMFIQSLKNLGNIWLWGGIGVFLIAILFSMILTSGVKGKSFYRAAIYLPNVVSAIAMATMWIQYAFNSKYGLFFQFFSFLGMDNAAAFQWTSPDNQFYAMLIAYSFGMVGYYVLIFMAGIEKIPSDYYEAAKLEGANMFHQFRHITIPLMTDVFRTSIVMWSISTVAFFIWSQVFSPLDPDVGTIVPMVYMYNLVFGRNLTLTDPTLLNAGAGAAVGVLMTLLVLLTFSMVNLVFRDKKLEF
ncbi:MULTISPECIES: carbohydrate ABC transporter permease [unclassified Oceanispirochaeta]|uniref:carbohydrate ABC transporter permease n=1 Tax=unclassified Oceanispirochaeta TaxID=2635722 RepID=UPI000E09CA73|nr:MULTISPECIES: sugar ABC transporter permease [unclassified Oceanispirochaeta]MBF9017729.1 sugar ABC transporter permease [Oceanispirochaeta sp. M2]NPD72132.1 sugar ABC transporter permease [Oceanispirochaeta sp. M1]RDG32574.1 sugar ABC transporter permease [Oceanispirochaeta sp. M1]